MSPLLPAPLAKPNVSIIPRKFVSGLNQITILFGLDEKENNGRLNKHEPPQRHRHRHCREQDGHRRFSDSPNLSAPCSFFIKIIVCGLTMAFYLPLFMAVKSTVV
ncbi:hypothetical protein Salat_1227400 [Sesamum alatum]|uniref:Uncharacterized protein n=1 Tax=Sesamum alatum TaxID=300844 RepID=A0AAE1YG59_9LAMI|nr:hypothetical protein Salat_1227400 [Sesamum alatum]